MFDLSVEVRTSTAMHPCKVHHADSSFDFAGQAFVVRACKKDAVAVALGVTLADNDVAESVHLCGVHNYSPLL
jgi:hypothetical protein